MNSSKWVALAFVTFLALGLAEALLAGDGPKAASALAEVSNQGNFPAILQGGFRYWSNGYLVTFDLEMVSNRAGVALYDRYGEVAREPIVWLDGAKSLS